MIKKQLQSIRGGRDAELTIFKPFNARIKATTLNIRSGLGTNYTSIEFLKKDDVIRVEKELVSGWYQIGYKDKIGWVAS